MIPPEVPHDYFPRRWRGHWIWVPEEPIEPAGFWSAGVNLQATESHGLFRKVFELSVLPNRAPVRITADSRYALTVNGREVGRGPIRSQPRRLYYDTYDLEPYLRIGLNIVAVYVKHFGTANAFWMPPVPNNSLGRGGILAFECSVGPSDWVVSDRTWKAQKASAWQDDWRRRIEHHAGVPIELFDARLFPDRWQELGFDDQQWRKAQLVPAMHVGGFARTQPPTDPYGPLHPRPIARLNGETRTPVAVTLEVLEGYVDGTITSPVTRIQDSLDLPALHRWAHLELPLTMVISKSKPLRLCLDMGSIVSGFVGFDIQAAAGTAVDFSYTEDPVQAPCSMDKMKAGTRYIARGTHDHYRLFDSNGFRYAYVLIHGVEGEVRLVNFEVLEHLYPWPQGTCFRCSDDELNRIFAAGIRTVQLCSHDAYIDCPTREQRTWVGDAVVHQMVHLAANPDWRLARHYVNLANSPRSDGILPMSVVGDIEASGGLTIPDWSLHWGHAAHNLYRFSGDQQAVKALMPTFERILRWYAPYQTSVGVLEDVPEWNLVDWSSVSTEGASSLLTALWARGLREYSEMAAWLNDEAGRRWAEEHLEKARAGFEVFWDDARGSYVDHLVDGAQRPAMSQLAGALAIVSGLAPTSRWDRIVNTVTDQERLVVRSWMGDGNGQQSMEKWQNQVRFGLYDIDWNVTEQIVLAQPFMSYVVHDAVALAGHAARLPQLYRRWSQFLSNGYDTLGECWDFGTHAHGWSATPTRDMIFYTLGVTPAEPGFTRARIAPRLGSLSWAQGVVPTPYGFITVEASREQLSVDSPVPILLELEGQAPRALPAGKHDLLIPREPRSSQ